MMSELVSLIALERGSMVNHAEKSAPALERFAFTRLSSLET